MMDNLKSIAYKQGYNYQLVENYSHQTSILGQSIKTAFIDLSSTGMLTVAAGYAWNGATDAIDTSDFMRGSLVHDALYQLMKEDHLPDTYRKTVDKLLIAICKEDGMPWLRRIYVYAAVRNFGGVVLRSDNNPVLYAPHAVVTES